MILSLSLPASSSRSHVLIVVCRSQQWLHLDGLVVFKVRPEEVQPITTLRFENAEEVALEEVDKIPESSAIKRTFAALSDEMTIPETEAVANRIHLS